ncbi:hypothetical protein P691DRAFT_808997 [Macrolepiota fuliginosa MF-IS2]|uniref:Uncharacterized protein n=1 Tax=Macrolepiota fuliginosa MF-IS2 TaxID=1400762 RepID=A0A9P5XIE6_9AGAR|nr:hypothetical protein P691DRAFT_808997 [Macrolepiota fuliginosa MF-IS2]
MLSVQSPWPRPVHSPAPRVCVVFHLLGAFLYLISVSGPLPAVEAPRSTHRRLAARTMHPALLLDEILDLVFFNLRVQRPGAGGRQPRNPEQPFQWTTLLSAALACKPFFEPAMRHLWHDIAGLDLLLLTMGQEVVGFEFIGDEPLPRSVFERRTALKPLHKVFPKTLLVRGFSFVSRFRSCTLPRF